MKRFYFHKDGDCGCGHDHGHGDCDCGHEHLHGDCDCGGDCDCETRKRRVILDARVVATLKGVVGALVDLNLTTGEDLVAALRELNLQLPALSLDVAKGCRGVRVELGVGAPHDAVWVQARIDLARRKHADAAALLEQIYRTAAYVQELEQGHSDAELGSFAREDVFTLLYLASLLLVETGTEGLTVTPVELGLGETEDNGVAVSRPASLAAKLAEGLDVTVTAGAAGVDIPTCALAAGCVVEQTARVEGLLSACGYGIDGDTVTRIYLVD